MVVVEVAISVVCAEKERLITDILEVLLPDDGYFSSLWFTLWALTLVNNKAITC